MIIQTKNSNYIFFKANLNPNKLSQKYVFNESTKQITSNVISLLNELYPKLKELSSNNAPPEKKSFYQKLKNAFSILSIGESLSEKSIIFRPLKDGSYKLVSKPEKKDDLSLIFVDLLLERTKLGIIQKKCKSYYYKDNQLVKDDVRFYTPRDKDLEFYDKNDPQVKIEASGYIQELNLIFEYLTKLKDIIYKYDKNPDTAPVNLVNIMAYHISTPPNIHHTGVEKLTEVKLKTKAALKPEAKPSKPATTSSKLKTKPLKPKPKTKAKLKKEAALKTEAKPSKPKPKPKTKAEPKPKTKRNDSCKEKQVLKEFKKVGIVPMEGLQLFQEISALFGEVYNKLGKIHNISTRCKIKYSCGPSLELHNTTTRALTFSKIGANGETICVNERGNISKGETNKYTIVLVTDKNKDQKYYILNSKGQLIKNPPKTLRFGKQQESVNNRIEYYTQDEINSLNLVGILSPLRDELTKYNEYIGKRLSELETKRTFFSHDNEGNLEDKRDTIRQILELHSTFKKHLFHFRRNDERRIDYMNQMECSNMNVSETILNNIGENHDTIRIVPRVYKENDVLLFQVLGSSSEVKKTYYFLDNKLVKNLQDELTTTPKIPYNKGIYFQSQEEINKSGVKELLDAIKERLSKESKIYEEVIQKAILTQNNKISFNSNKIVSDAVKQLFDNIKKLFNNIYVKLSTIDDISARSTVKHAYANLSGGNNGSSQVLTYKEIGQNGEDISVNVAKYNSDIEVLVKDKDKKQLFFVLDVANSMIKKSITRPRSGRINDDMFYTQDELKSFDLVNILKLVIQELEKHNQDIETKIKAMKSRHRGYSF